MIIIIDEKTGDVFHTKFKTKAAAKIGVHRNTVSNWINGGNKSEQYNRYKVYFNSKEL